MGGLTGPAIAGAVAAFLAAAVNAVAGGGTFIAFPMLTGVVGLSEKLANATCTVGLWPGYASAVLAAWREIAALPRRATAMLTAASVAGGASGGALLLLTPPDVFRQVVPILLGVGTLLFAAGPRFNRQLDRAEPLAAPGAAAMPGVFAVAIYNGYFGAGGGVLVIAALTAAGLHDARRANILKMVVQVTSNAAALMVLVWWGVAWPAALGMMPGAIAGGFAGMRLANAIPRRMLRAIILAAGVTLTIVYGLKALR